MINLEIKLQEIKGIGPSMLRILRNHNIWSTYDLILNYPKSYQDFTIVSLDKALDRDTITVQAVISTELVLQRFSKRERIIFNAKIFDQTIEVVVFGRSYLMKQLKVGDAIVIKGVYHLYKQQVVAAAVLMLDKKVPIKPIYGIEGIYDRTLSTIVQSIFDDKKVSIFETIPKQFIDLHHLMPRALAYQTLHLPQTVDDIHKAENFVFNKKKLMVKANARRSKLEKIEFVVTDYFEE